MQSPLFLHLQLQKLSHTSETLSFPNSCLATKLFPTEVAKEVRKKKSEQVKLIIKVLESGGAGVVMWQAMPAPVRPVSPMGAGSWLAVPLQIQLPC